MGKKASNRDKHDSTASDLMMATVQQHSSMEKGASDVSIPASAISAPTFSTSTFESNKTDDGIEGLKNKLLEAQKESENNKNLMLGALADLDNYRKRMQKERAEIRNNTIAEIIETILPILDNFELGLLSAEQHGAKNIADGFRMILVSLQSLLTSYGVQELYPLNEKFDMNFHDCVRQVKDTESENDTIVAVDRKGYVFNGKLLRPAMVAVACKN